MSLMQSDLGMNICAKTFYINALEYLEPACSVTKKAKTKVTPTKENT